MGVSGALHMALLLMLTLLVLPEKPVVEFKNVVAELFEREEDIVEIELDQELEATDELVANVSNVVSDAGAMGAASLSETAAQIDEQVFEEADTTNIAITGLAMVGPPSDQMISEVPEGAIGDPRAVVDDYGQAMDRLTQEILLMLDKSNVLAIWCFDQSESMKDDQQEIRARIDKVYEELGLTNASASQALMTAVTSYGAEFSVLTKKPTNDIAAIRAAIGKVQVDDSGKEIMCEAVTRAISGFRKYARGSKRQMALILVTDESGDRTQNERALELAIDTAKQAKCRIYTLGREAVFGYPYQHVRWRHPETGRIHWLQIDRGPETAFVQQLQTNGLWKRYDALSSGFGSYEQARMARESGGIFFMLPSVETATVRGSADKRRYELEAMRAYRPDLRTRELCAKDRDKYKLHAVLTKVIYDLNPYNPAAAKIIVMRHRFSPKANEFQKQATQQIKKALVYLPYLVKASEVVEGLQSVRGQESDPRWQGNYDLLRAQMIAYQALVYEYAAYLEAFLKDPKSAPPTKAPNLLLTHWDIGRQKKLLNPDVSQPLIDKATALFKQVLVDHPGTPWAERAKQELNQGFGINLHPVYWPPYKKPSGKIKIPKY